MCRAVSQWYSGFTLTHSVLRSVALTITTKPVSRAKMQSESTRQNLFTAYGHRKKIFFSSDSYQGHRNMCYVQPHRHVTTGSICENDTISPSTGSNVFFPHCQPYESHFNSKRTTLNSKTFDRRASWYRLTMTTWQRKQIGHICIYFLYD